MSSQPPFGRWRGKASLALAKAPRPQSPKPSRILIPRERHLGASELVSFESFRIDSLPGGSTFFLQSADAEPVCPHTGTESTAQTVLFLSDFGQTSRTRHLNGLGELETGSQRASLTGGVESLLCEVPSSGNENPSC